MFVDSIISCFKDKQFDIPESDFKTALSALYDEYKERYPVFEELKSIISEEGIVELTLQKYCTEKNIPNPYVKIQQEILRSHDFFKNRSYVCAAPLTSLRFDFGGRMTVCCYNVDYNLGFYPEVSPYEAWTGERIKNIRNALANYDFSFGCQRCARYILAGNGHNSALAVREAFVPNIEQEIGTEYPAHLVFQIHNTCNYECIMCGGEFSSSIRKNREKLPLQANMYDDRFITEIEPFLKHAKVIEFLGGEPFVMSTYYKMWDVIARVNPNVMVSIVSNGSVYNDKVEKALKGLLNVWVNVSIDSINPKTYAFMRKNGNLENVLSNINALHKLGKFGALSIVPIIQNIYEIPEIIEYCMERNIPLWFNSCEGPLGEMIEGIHKNGVAKHHTSLPEEEQIPEFRLWTLPLEEREKIKTFLSQKTYPKQYQDGLDGCINFIMNHKP